MLKKNSIILITVLLIISICGISNGAELKTSLDIMQKASETKYLENDQGFISKTIVDSNADTGEITIELKLSNTKKEIETKKYDSTEVIFVIDNSLSMEEKVNKIQTRRDIVILSAKEFTSSLFKDVNNIKVGLVYYYGYDSKDDEGKNSIQSVGDINTAKILSDLTDKEDTIQNALSSFANMSYNYGTNIDSGLQKAKLMFSSNNNTQKFIILLSDGVPNQAISVPIKYGGIFGMSKEKHQSEVNSRTKATIQSFSNNDINLITIITGLGDLEESDRTVLETVFGTVSNTTYGLLFNIKDTDIEKIIKQDIYNEVLEKIQNPINTVKIVDYFPDDITENFDFSYVGDATVGTKTDGIDPETNTIVWNIDTLKGDEVATLKYKLKIKDMKNTKILNKTIATNEKVVLTYKDIDSKDYTVELTSSPKIKLSEIKEELTATVSYDPTTETTGKVTATIKTNKKVNKVDGWNLSDDGKISTKVYSENKTEIVHLVDEDNMEKDVEIKISNIIAEEPKDEIKEEPKEDTKKQLDETTAKERLPQTGLGIGLTVSIIAISLICVISYTKYKKLRIIK